MYSYCESDSIISRFLFVVRGEKWLSKFLQGCKNVDCYDTLLY